VLFEIVYPENRIVLDYGGRDDLMLLGAVEIATGRSVGPNDSHACGGRGRAPSVRIRDGCRCARRPAAPNAEGLVLHLIDTDERVKIKQEDYVALHRIVTGLNERTVWEH
jgi:RNA ligase